MKRNYKHIKGIANEINKLREEGRTRQEIADKYGLTIIQIKNLINRQNRAEREITAGIVPRRRGRPPKGEQTTDKQKDSEIKRLTMENKLLRDFLRLVGRR